MRDQVDMFGREDVGEVGDDLGRFFTPAALSSLILERVDLFFETAPDVVVEPSVGDGGFVAAVRKRWPEAFVVGVDLDPNARGLTMVDAPICGDFLEVVGDVAKLVAKKRFRGRGGNVATVGKAPFATKTQAEREQTIAHVQAARSLPGLTALVLPWSFLAVEAYAPIMQGADAPRYAWPFFPRPWPKNLREAAAYLWLEATNNGRTQVEPLPRWRA